MRPGTNTGPGTRQTRIIVRHAPMNNNPANQTNQQKPLSVSRLIGLLRGTIEPSFKSLWITGELTNFSAATSGHWYFSLKDDKAQIRCAMFKGKNRFCRYRPKDGEQVMIRANASIYEARGDLQLIVDWMEPAGVGALQLAFLQLKEKLHKEGLFDAERKKSLPDRIHTIGIVTSPAGAAIHDIISVLKRRDPFKHVIIYPANVQGKDAATSLIQAIEIASARAEVDVLIITRGGGSLEDLWCFNDEQLARAIAACPIPTISAVGHEVDFTICDWVADLRLPTPSAAAEYVSNDVTIMQRQLAQLAQRLSDTIWYRLQSSMQQLDWLSARLPTPQNLLKETLFRLQDLEWRLDKSAKGRLVNASVHVANLRERLSLMSPATKIKQYEHLLAHLLHRAESSINASIHSANERLAQLAGHLQGVSPLATLARGYSITEVVESSQLLRADTPLSPGSVLRTRLDKRVVLSKYLRDEEVSHQ